MGSSAQNSSSVHWCRCRVRFNEISEKGSENSGDNYGKFWYKAKSDSIGSRKNSGEGLGGFGTEPNQIHQISGKKSG